MHIIILYIQYITMISHYTIYYFIRRLIMALGKDKTRILVNLPIELKQELETYAKQNNRSLSNYIVYLISKYKDQEQEKGL